MGCCSSRERESALRRQAEEADEPPGSDEELDEDEAAYELPLVPPPTAVLRRMYGDRDFEKDDRGIIPDHPKQERLDDLDPAEADDGRFLLRGPTLAGAVTAINCHPEGSLYRIADGRSWALYNDSPQHEMTVILKFTCKNTTHGRPRVRRLDDAEQLERTICDETPYGGKANLTYEHVPIRVILNPGETHRVCRCTVERSFLCYTVEVRTAMPQPEFWRDVKRRRDGVVERQRDLCSRLVNKTTMADPLLLATTIALQNLPFVDYFFNPNKHSLARTGADGCDDEAELMALPDSATLGRRRQYIAWMRFAQLRSSKTAAMRTEVRHPMMHVPDDTAIPRVDFEAAINEYFTYDNHAFRPVNTVVPRFLLPLPLRVQHGSVGSDWLACAMASVAELPAVINRMFCGAAQAQIGPFGGHLINICVNGWWHAMPLDDLFPAFGLAMITMQSALDRGELWPALIEKAIAKTSGATDRPGAYAAIRAGDIAQGTVPMTGCPTMRIRNRFEEVRRETPEQVFTYGDTVMFWRARCKDGSLSAKLFADLLLLFEGRHVLNDPWQPISGDPSEWLPVAGRHNLVMFETKAPNDFDTSSAAPSKEQVAYEQRLRKAGLLPGHSYTVLDMVLHRKSNGDTMRMVKLRNPFPDVMLRRAQLVVSPQISSLASVPLDQLHLWREEFSYLSEDSDAKSGWQLWHHSWDEEQSLDDDPGEASSSPYGCVDDDRTGVLPIICGVPGALERFSGGTQSVAMSKALLEARRKFGKAISVNDPFDVQTEASSEDGTVKARKLRAASAMTVAEERHTTFWVEWEAAVTLFRGVGVSFIRSNMFDFRAAGEFLTSGLATFAIELAPKRAADIMVMLTQPDTTGYQQPVSVEAQRKRTTATPGSVLRQTETELKKQRRRPEEIAQKLMGQIVEPEVESLYLPISVAVVRPDVIPGRSRTFLSSDVNPSEPRRLDEFAPRDTNRGVVFLQQREVAVEFQLPATDRPYLIIPRFSDDLPLADLDEPQLLRRFVLTLMSTVQAEELDVRFIRLHDPVTRQPVHNVEGPDGEVLNLLHTDVFEYIPQAQKPAEVKTQARTRLEDDLTHPHPPEFGRGLKSGFTKTPKVGRGQ